MYKGKTKPTEKTKQNKTKQKNNNNKTKQNKNKKYIDAVFPYELR